MPKEYKIKSFKEIIKDKRQQKIKLSLPSLQTIDFRASKKIDEKVHGNSDWYGLDKSKYAARETTAHELKELHRATDKDTINHLEHYTSESHHLNKSLFKNEGNHEHYYDKIIHHLDKHLSTRPAHKDFHVYSGLYRKPSEGIHLHHSYMSTSLHPHVAGKFCNACTHEKGEDYHILKIKIPKGSKHGAHIEEHSEHSDEREFLLGRGKKIKIHPDPEKHGPYHIWHAEIQD